MDIKGYKIRERISYEDATDFFKSYLKKKNIVTIIYFLNIIVSCIFIIVNIIKEFTFEFIMTSLGEVIFILIPYLIIHELLHLVGYIMVGAKKKLSIGMDKGIFYATSSDYIMSCGKYKFSALLPTIVISVLSIAAYIIFNNLRAGISMFYLIQLAASYVDIAIASYCSLNKDLYYCEDKELKEMYFLKKEMGRDKNE